MLRNRSRLLLGIVLAIILVLPVYRSISAYAAPGGMFIRGYCTFDKGTRRANDVIEYKYSYQTWKQAENQQIPVGYASVWTWRNLPYRYNFTASVNSGTIIVVRLRNTQTGQVSSAQAVAPWSQQQGGDADGMYARVIGELKY